MSILLIIGFIFLYILVDNVEQDRIAAEQRSIDRRNGDYPWHGESFTSTGDDDL